MRIDVYFAPGELTGAELADRAVVIDVLRATSTVVEALANGAKAVLPVETADDAMRLAQNVGRDSVLLCGERKSLPIEGFDLGNSPLEYTREQVEDKSLIMTTTNGTRAFLAVSERRGTSAAEGGAIMIASFLNLSAVVGRTLEGEGSVALVCAGREGRFGLDDAACAGALIRGIEERGVETRLNDAGRAARALTGEAGIGETLHASAAGRNLLALELGADVAFCAQVDRTSVVPVLRERKITIE